MIREAITRFLQRTSDIFIQGKNKSHIAIGTDRKKELNSGYGDGGENDVDSAMVDIVAGFPADAENPDYENDKSRIYVAEKTDPDEYFAINKGNAVEGEPSIVQISDNIYLKARNNIKILNGNVSILIDSDGNIQIESSNSATLKVGSSRINITQGGIELDTGEGAGGGAIITSNDVCTGIDPVTGAQIVSNFKQAPAFPTRNSKVTIK